MVKLVDTTDLGSVEYFIHIGSNPIILNWK
jgi:hypothetical protein